MADTKDSTPGPWTVEDATPDDDSPMFWSIAGPHTFKVADVYLSAADARLIAAAPRMRDALEVATAALENALLHQGRHMTDADVAGRERIIRDARAILRDVDGQS